MSESNQKRSAEERRKAGHAEVQGETLAKFEFFQQGWNPYSRYLDVDKVDLLLRRRTGSAPEYREIQVKYGKLHVDLSIWEKQLFDRTSWKFVDQNEFVHYGRRRDFYVAFVLATDHGYEGDIFIFPILDYIEIVAGAISTQTKGGEKRKLYISRSRENNARWFVRNVPKKFSVITKENAIEVTKYRRNFELLEE